MPSRTSITPACDGPPGSTMSLDAALPTVDVPSRSQCRPTTLNQLASPRSRASRRERSASISARYASAAVVIDRSVGCVQHVDDLITGGPIRDHGLVKLRRTSDEMALDRGERQGLHAEADGDAEQSQKLGAWEAHDPRHRPAA